MEEQIDNFIVQANSFLGSSQNHESPNASAHNSTLTFNKSA